ncbi:MAG: efflux RND transporter periplasmic adaptor subunit [Nitratireductor sp.]|nr:efflux RND transporter periplasmic adaptor subunit [Nitratireductor sp.]
MLTRNAQTGEAEAGMEGNKSASASTLARVVLQIVLMLLVLAAGFLAMSRLIATKPETGRRTPFPTVYTVDTVTVERADYRPVYTVYGEVVSGRSVDLRSLAAGEVIEISPSLKAGAAVSKGEALVRIDPFGYEGALREAKANLAETEARIAEMNVRIRIEESRLESSEQQLELARRDLERIRELKGRGAATDKQLEDRELVASQRQAAVDQTRIGIAAEKAKLAQQEAALQRLQWKVDQAERNLKDTVLIAPFDGIIRSASVETGKMINANDIAVALYERGNMEVRFTLTDDRFARLQSEPGGFAGRMVEVIHSAGSQTQSVPARMDRLGADIASNRGGVEIYAAIDAATLPAALRPGAFVAIQVPDRSFANHVRLPSQALFGTDTVYVVVDGKLQARKVAVAAFDGNAVIVDGDLAPGEEVLATHIAEISEGLKVRTGAQ